MASTSIFRPGCSWSSCSTLRRSNHGRLGFHLGLKAEAGQGCHLPLGACPAHAFFMALWGTDRLCSQRGSGDEILKLLRNQHFVHTRLTSSVTVESTVQSTVSDSTMRCVSFFEARPALLRLIAACCFLNMEVKELSFPTSDVCYSLPQAGATIIPKWVDMYI
jgi:hypothetical protein